MLRFDSSVQITSRQVLQDTEVAGVPVRAGERVIVYLGAANRDPDRFADPDRLDLTRADNAPLSFGGGIHYCLGAPLARLEAQVALPALFTRFGDIALAGPAERRNSLTLRGYLRLPHHSRLISWGLRGDSCHAISDPAPDRRPAIGTTTAITPSFCCGDCPPGPAAPWTRAVGPAPVARRLAQRAKAVDAVDVSPG